MFASRRKPVFFVVIGFLLTSVAAAQMNNRSAVSVTGTDAATCTVPDPCRTFAVALSRTNFNGEVVALTSGGYGPFTIDRTVSIVAAPGVYAALVASAGDAITVNAANPGFLGIVVIRGLHLYGMGTGNGGIVVTGNSEVHVEHCVIDGFNGFGISSSLPVFVSDTTIRNTSVGIEIDNAGTVVKGTINRVEVRNCGNGIRSSRNADVTVRDSVVADCSGEGFRALGGQLNIEHSLATRNGIGVGVDNSGTVRVSNTMATGNGNGFFSSGPLNTFISWGNNEVRGNGTNKTGTITVVTQD